MSAPNFSVSALDLSRADEDLEAVERRRITAAVADVGELVEVDGRHHRAGGSRLHGRREAGVRQVEPDARTAVALHKPRPVQPRIQHHSRRERIDVVERGAPVRARQEVAGGDVVEEVAAVLQAIVVPHAEEQLVDVAHVVVDPAEEGLEIVGPGRGREEVVHGARLVRQRNVLQQILRDRVEPVGRDDVARERRAAHARALLHARQRIIQLVRRARRQQRREVAVAHVLRRHRGVLRPGTRP